MKVILFEPQIPQNTGNVARTCSVTGCGLILVRPLGFQISDRWLKRSGLDYWDALSSFDVIDDLEAYLEKTKSPWTFFSSHAKTLYTDITYSDDHLLIFGSETSGLPETLHQTSKEQGAKLPMQENARCLNLATSVGVALYEALRQSHFQGLL